MNVFSEIQHYRHLDIEVEVTTLCNFKCPYCCAKTESRKFISKSDISKLLDFISPLPLPVTVCITGGEPALYPHLKYLVSELDKAPQVDVIEIYTNASKPLKVESPKLHLLCTWHPKFTLKEVYYANLLKYKGCVEAVPLVMPKYSYTGLQEFCSKHGIPVQYEYLRTADKTLLSKSPFKAQARYQLNGRKLSLEDVLKGFDRFKGWWCEQSLLTIDTQGNVRNCLGQVGNIFQGRFKYEVHEVQCPKERCGIDCFLGTLKHD